MHNQIRTELFAQTVRKSSAFLMTGLVVSHIDSEQGDGAAGGMRTRVMLYIND